MSNLIAQRGVSDRLDLGATIENDRSRIARSIIELNIVSAFFESYIIIVFQIIPCSICSAVIERKIGKGKQNRECSRAKEADDDPGI